MNVKGAVTAHIMIGPDPQVPDDMARQLRRADEFIVLATMAARQAVDAAPQRELTPQEVGLFIGTAYGPLNTNFQSLGSLIDDGEGQISPTLFSHSVFNAAAGYVARLLDIQGPACTLTTFAWPFLMALQEGWLAVKTGRVQRAVIIGVEVYSELLRDALARSPVPGAKEAGKDLEHGAVAWILEPAGSDSTNPVMEKIEVVEIPSSSDLLLTRVGEYFGELTTDEYQPKTPLAHAQALHQGLINSQEGEKQIRFEAPFGKASILVTENL